MFFLALLFIATLTSGSKNDKILYGEDDRLEALIWINDDNAIKSALALADVALISGQNINDPTGSPSLINRRLWTDFYNGTLCPVCSSERFVGQPADAFCSGVLFRDRHTILTAAHCIDAMAGRKIARSLPCSQNDDTYMLFDYRMGEGDIAPSSNIAYDNLYRCMTIEYARYDRSHDFALIRLDREVSRSRVPLQPECGELEIDTALLIAGHPLGLPEKVAEGITVLDIDKLWFGVNADSYAGNSGSSLVNAETGKVVGILIAGQPDFVSNHIESCCESAKCPQSGCVSGRNRYAEVGYMISNMTCSGNSLSNFLFF